MRSLPVLGLDVAVEARLSFHLKARFYTQSGRTLPGSTMQYVSLFSLEICPSNLSTPNHTHIEHAPITPQRELKFILQSDVYFGLCCRLLSTETLCGT